MAAAPAVEISAKSLRSRNRTNLILLVVGTLLVFGAVPFFDFVDWDDGVHVYKNPALLTPSIQSILWFWSHPYEGLYMPVTYTAWALIAPFAVLSQPDARGLYMRPGPYHAANLLFHLANVWLVYQLLLALFFAIHRKEHPEERGAKLRSQERIAASQEAARRLAWNGRAAFFGALDFAIHPIQAEAVAWVTGLKDVLASSLGLSGLLAFLIYILRQEQGLGAEELKELSGVSKYLQFRKIRSNYLASCVLVALAVLAKPSMLSLPLVAAVLLVCASPAFWSRLRLLGPWILISLPVAWVTKTIQPSAFLKFVPAVFLRPLVALDAIAFYLGKILVPVHLSPLYDRAPQEALASSSLALGVGAALAVFGLAFWLVRRRQFFALGVFILTASLTPVLGFAPFSYQQYSTVADRYVYFGMFGVAFSVGALLAKLRPSGWDGVFTPRVWIVPTALVILFGVLGFQQALHWRTSQGLLEYALAENPKNLVAHLNLGAAYSAGGKTDDALREFDEALKLSPENSKIYFNIGNVKAKEGKLPEAIEVYTKALSIDPADTDVRNNLGTAYARMGDLASATREFAEAVRSNPQLAEAHNNLGQALAMQGRLSEAIEEFKRALAIKPYMVDARTNLERALNGWN